MVTALQLFRIFCYNFGSNGRQMTYFGENSSFGLTSVGNKQYKVHDVKEIENMFVATINLLKIRKCVSSEDQKGSEYN